MKEFMMFTFFITAPASGIAGNEGDAYRNVALASYKQSGLEAMMDQFVERELRKVPKEIQTVASNIFLVGKSIQERRIVYTWSF